MRVKQLMTFHPEMGKKASAGRTGRKRKSREDKETQSPPAKVVKMDAGTDEVWRPSKCGERDLLLLVAVRFLQERSMVEWRPAGTDESRFELTNESVLFTHFIEWGLALPPSNFFQGLLHFYKLHLFHLNPNSIVHISIFIHLCEAFLGIQPHFNLFRYLFYLKP
jgi:hypothetical protein